MTEVNRIAAHYNPDGSLKPADQVKPEALPTSPAPAQQATIEVNTQEIHQAPLSETVASRINDLKTRFERFLKEEPANDLDNGIVTEKTQGQRTLEALFAEVQAANKEAVASKLGNRNLLDIDTAVPEAPKLISDIASYAKGNADLKKLFADPDVKNSVLNLLAYNMTAKQVKDAFANTDKDSQIKMTNLTKTVSPVEDSLKLFSAKGALYFEEITKVFKPFMEGYSGIIEAHSKDLINLLKEKAPELKEKFSATNPADIVAIGEKFEQFAPEVSQLIKSQSSTVGNFVGDWVQNNMKPLFGLVANGIGALKTIFQDINRTVPGAQQPPSAEELEKQFAPTA